MTILRLTETWAGDPAPPGQTLAGPWPPAGLPPVPFPFYIPSIPAGFVPSIPIVDALLGGIPPTWSPVIDLGPIPTHLQGAAIGWNLNCTSRAPCVALLYLGAGLSLQFLAGISQRAQQDSQDVAFPVGPGDVMKVVVVGAQVDANGNPPAITTTVTTDVDQVR